MPHDEFEGRSAESELAQDIAGSSAATLPARRYESGPFECLPGSYSPVPGKELVYPHA